DLHAAFLTVAPMDDGQTISNVLLARWLRDHNEVPINSLMLSGGPGVDEKGSPWWTLVPTKLKSPPPPPSQKQPKPKNRQHQNPQTDHSNPQTSARPSASQPSPSAAPSKTSPHTSSSSASKVVPEKPIDGKFRKP